MSIKGNSKEMLIGRTEINLLSYIIGKNRKIQFDEITKLEYTFYIGGNGGYINIGLKTGEKVPFVFPKSENSKVLKLISHAKEYWSKVDIIELPSEKQKFYQTWGFIIFSLVFFLPLGLFLLWKNQKGRTPSRIMISALAIIFWAYAYYSYDGSEASSLNSSAEESVPVEYISVTVDELNEILDENPLKADETYEGQYLSVTGELSNIDSDGEYISIVGTGVFEIIGVHCSIMNEDQKDFVMNLSIGDTLTVKGKCTNVGEIMGYTIDIDSIEK